MSNEARIPSKDDPKEEKFWRIMDAILLLDITKGHLRWNITEVARRAKVTRPLIYYYFGKSKAGMLDTALQMLASEFFGLSAERLKLWETGSIMESILRSRELVRNSPHTITFYFYWRNSNTDIARKLIDFEDSYINKVCKFFPHLSVTEARSIFAAFFGLCMIPDLRTENIEQIAGAVFKRMMPR